MIPNSTLLHRQRCFLVLRTILENSVIPIVDLASVLGKAVVGKNVLIDPFAKLRIRFVHDPQKVMVCSKWLHGRCNSSNCALQHHRRPELMPHCIPYQKGECNRLNCPFMHSVYNPTAPPCINFYRSYCPRGANCWRQHVRESKGNRF